MNIVGSAIHSPVDIVMMLSSKNIPYVLVPGKVSEDDKCVFVFTSSGVLHLAKDALKSKQGTVVLLDIETELLRWENLRRITESNQKQFDQIVIEECGKIKIGKRLEKPDVILEALDTADTGVLKPIMTLVYTINKRDIREKVKHDIFKWITGSDSIDSLLGKVLTNLPKQTDASKLKLDEFEKTLNGKSIADLRDAFREMKKRKITVEEVAEEFNVESFEMIYIQKYLDKPASQ